VIDLHCHILPGIDDGPPTMADSLALARAAVGAGTTTIAATPHVSWDCSANTSALIARKVAEVRAALDAEGFALTLATGGEVALTRALELPDDELAALRLGGGPWLLLECPLSPTALNVESGLDALRERGHRLLLAHPERVPAFQRDPAMLARQVEQGSLTSMTAGAFTGRFGKEVQRFTFRLLEDGLVHSAASDAHSVDRRPPDLAPALRQAGLEDWQIDWLARTAPLAILRGEELPPPPAMDVAPRSGRLGRLLGR
jgi:protein-tyrosine phosphatase